MHEPAYPLRPPSDGIAEGLDRTELPGVWVRCQRRAAELTQEQLAARSGLGVRTISDLERGIRSPHPRSLRLVTGALRLSETAADRLVAWYRAAGKGMTVLSPQIADAHVEKLPPMPLDGMRGQAGCAPAVVPRQLPAACPYFIGRAAELAFLDGWVEQVPEAAGAVTNLVICGMAGVGKTALALRWAHRVARQFPDGQLYANLGGYGPGGRPADPADVIRRFLSALGAAPGWVPAGADGQAGLYRSMLAGRRVLIVADNARDAAQVRTLLPGVPGCLVLVTSRGRLTGLVAAEGAHVLNLEVPSAAEAAELLSARVGSGRVAAEAAAVSELIGACGRLPLALAVVAAHAGASGWPLAALAARLADAREQLGALEHGDAAASVQTVFSWSYRQLGTAAARVFRLLGIHPGPEISALAVASLAGLPSQPALAALRELADVGLAAELIPGRYSLHDLIRVYAAGMARERETGKELEAAAHRMLDYYLRTAAAASRVLDPGQEPMTLGPPRRGVTPEVITDVDQALAWFAAERKVLLAILGQVAKPTFDAHALRLSWAMVCFLQRNGQFHDLADSQRAALACAERLGDLAGQARTHRHLGGAYAQLGQASLAHTHLTRGVELSRQLGDHAEEARAHICLSALFEREERLRDAFASSLRALCLAQMAGDALLQAKAFNNIGYHHAALGDIRQGLTSCQRSLDLARKIGNPSLEASTLHSLGYIHRHLGDYRQAASSYQQAIRLFRELGAPYQAARSLANLGDTYYAVSDTHAARETWHQALAILDDLFHPEAIQVRRRLQDSEQAY